jgi:hypothetical protein
MAHETPSQVAEQMFEFEASGSVEKTGAGARQEGAKFEELVRLWWSAVAIDLIERGAEPQIFDKNGRRWARLTVPSGKSLVLPARTAPETTVDELEQRWLETTYRTESIVEAFGQPELVAAYAPDRGPFEGANYSKMYNGIETQFDDTVLLEDNGALHEKLLLEYKSAKSTKKKQIDGNAHERLSFQMMQYLEIATRYTRCSFVVFTNGAYARYRNKYHVNFHIQSDRLRNFAWFNMAHVCTPSEINAVHLRLRDWLKVSK